MLPMVGEWRADVVLALSPHLDDAALSVGALLARLAGAGSRIEVHTMFAGDGEEPLSAVAQALHRECGLGADAAAVRRREDAVAVAELGAVPCHWEFADAVYRRSADGRWVCEDDDAIFADDLPAEPDLTAAIATHAADVLDRLAPSLILCSAADGGHVDHRIAYDCAVAVARLRSVPLLLWEDLPYAVDRLPVGSGRYVACEAPPGAWERKWRAIARYRSQVRMLWPDVSEWPALLHQHALRRGCGRPVEVLWTGVEDVRRSRP